MLKRVTLEKGDTFTRWIEEEAHKHLPVPPSKIRNWVLQNESLSFFGFTRIEELYSLTKYSTVVHGIFTGDQVILHPDGFREYMTTRMTSLIRKNSRMLSLSKR